MSRGSVTWGPWKTGSPYTGSRSSSRGPPSCVAREQNGPSPRLVVEFFAPSLRAAHCQAHASASFIVHLSRPTCFLIPRRRPLFDLKVSLFRHLQDHRVRQLGRQHGDYQYLTPWMAFLRSTCRPADGVAFAVARIRAPISGHRRHLPRTAGLVPSFNGGTSLRCA